MAKPTFTPRLARGEPMADPVEYTVMIYLCGTEAHRLALHREVTGWRRMPERDWAVSHPVLGGKILSLPGTRHFTATRARQEALHRLDLLVETVGSDHFNSVIAKLMEQGTPQ